MNEKQTQALEFAKEGHNIYVGGQAGTGKSFLLREIFSWAKQCGKSVALTATTGVACCLFPEVFGAMTLHKWSGLGDGRLNSNQLTALMNSEDDRYTPAMKRIQNVDMLIIDEVSMLSRKVYETLEAVMRNVRGKEELFGGVQVVLCGDFLQLPPVKHARYNDNGEFCFLSKLFPVHVVFLTQVLRQQDRIFSNVVNDLARGDARKTTIDYVKGLSRPLQSASLETSRLFSSNVLADIYNRDCLLKLDGDVYEFESIDDGDERQLRTLTVQKTLWLKKGAKQGKDKRQILINFLKVLLVLWVYQLENLPVVLEIVGRGLEAMKNPVKHLRTRPVKHYCGLKFMYGKISTL